MKRSKKKLKIALRQTQLKTEQSKNLGEAAKVVVRGRFTATQAYLKKTRDISNKQSNFTPE